MEAHLADYLRGNPAIVAKYTGSTKRSFAEFIEDFIDGKIEVLGNFQEFLRQRSHFFSFAFIPDHFKFFFTKMIPEVLIHSKKQDIEIGKEHYNRGNDFFHAFLGPSMIYTSAFFQTGTENLEDAQDNKLKLICEKLQLQTGQKLLDIGCGWGTLCRYASEHYQVDSTGITVAPEGMNYGNEQIEKAGVSDRARILKLDYRDIPKGKYDKISCVEMAEHVGILRFLSFLKQVNGLLEEDGLFYLQIAGLKAGYSQEGLAWGLFMNKYVFPGADASLPLSFVVANLEQAGFEIHSVENVGIHYSKTIDFWYQNWLKSEKYILEHYGLWWFRLWQVFLSWSVEIAAQGNSTCFQVISHKNKETFNRNTFIGNTKVNLGERDLV